MSADAAGAAAVDAGTRALEHICRELESFAPVLEGGVLLLRRLDVRVGIEQVREATEAGRVSLRFEIAAHHAMRFPRGIREAVHGFGTSREDALALATGGWCRNVLPVIGSLLGEPPSSAVRRLELAMHSDEARAGFGWLLHMGPLETTISERGVDPAELLRSLLEKMKPRLDEPCVHWLRCSLAHLPGRDPEVECRFDNEPWDDGAARLLQIAREWSSVRAYKLRRQFFLFEPRPLEQLRYTAPSPPAADPAARSRWKFWR